MRIWEFDGSEVMQILEGESNAFFRKDGTNRALTTRLIQEALSLNHSIFITASDSDSLPRFGEANVTQG